MRFHSFIIFGEMRTGSNFLESNLNAFDGVTSHGEAFNPHFIGFPNRSDLLGLRLEDRVADPSELLDRIEAQPDLNGFRFFHDHDPRILDRCLSDPRWAKIILTRNPAESFVSWKTAEATGQWKLSNGLKARSSKVRFDAAEFDAYLERLNTFQAEVLHRLQASGQTAFYLNYEDINDLDVLNGLAQWLGCDDTRETLDQSLKKQGLGSVLERVTNPKAMETALARVDAFQLSRVPTLEPRRGPVVPSYIGSKSAGLLYQPVRAGPEHAVRDWMTAFGGQLDEGFNQKTLRAWQRAVPAHRAFTVLRNPVARAHAAFCEKILPVDGYVEIRSLLTRFQQVPLTDDPNDPDYDHQAAFKAFLRFVGRNLAGQTNIRIDPYWISQSAVVEGFGQFRVPDAMIREGELTDGLRWLTGRDDLPVLGTLDPHGDRLRAIYDSEIEELTRAAYRRDYVNYGFGDYA